MKKGKLIVLDGIDGSGKTTQIKLLIRHLRKIRKKTYLTDFPQYEKSFFGRMVRRYLNGDFGQTKRTDPYLISMLYAFDRFEVKEKMWQHIKQGTIVISDRYSPANKIHQAIKIKNTIKRKKFTHWLDEMEFKILGIPKPDLVLFLDVPPAMAKRLTISRGKRDMHETDHRHQKDAYQQSLELIRKYRGWRRIVCVENGKLLAPKIIHEKIWREVNKIL
ncbi:MAG: thymidylate kinase [Patescibacteria group bacterium]